MPQSFPGNRLAAQARNGSWEAYPFAHCLWADSTWKCDEHYVK